VEITQELEQFIRKEILVKDDASTLDPEESLLETGVVDSLGILRLVTFIEERFGVVIGDVDVVPENFETIKAMESLIERRRAEA